MPELHNLTPPLGVLLDKASRWRSSPTGGCRAPRARCGGHHVTPEAADGGPLAYVRNGDVIRVDAHKGTLEIKVATNELMSRDRAATRPSQPGYGRELFGLMRAPPAPPTPAPVPCSRPPSMKGKGA